MLSSVKPSSSSVARIESRPPGTQHSEAHSIILAICTDSPTGNPSMTGKVEKIAVSQARPAISTSISASKACLNDVIPIWPTICADASTSSWVRSGMPSMPITPLARTASEITSFGISPGINARRNLSCCSRAISRTKASVSARCGAAPAEPAEPMTRGISYLRAAISTLRRSRLVDSRAVAILPLPR